MELERPATPATAAGVAGPLRLGAVLLIFCIAGLGVLTVLDVLPRTMFTDYAGKIGLAGGIVVLAAVAAALVLKSGRR